MFEPARQWSMEEVSAFFDRNGTAYAARVKSPDRLLLFPYQARLEVALRDLDLEGANVLDIGAGSGELYARIMSRPIKVNYSCCDVSSVLLDLHMVSDERKWLGEIFTSPFHRSRWDVIFLIGVAAYLDNPGFDRHIAYFRSHLKKDGQVILSFTNADSWAVRLRRWTRSAIPRSWIRSRTMGQPFSMNAMTFNDVQERCSHMFQVQLKCYIYPRGIPEWWGIQWAPEFVVALRFSDQLS